MGVLRGCAYTALLAARIAVGPMCLAATPSCATRVRKAFCEVSYCSSASPHLCTHVCVCVCVCETSHNSVCVARAATSAQLGLLAQ